jgi:riboflavin transporter 2
VKEWPVVYLITLTGAAACLLMAFFWDRVTVIAGVEHSTALLTLAAILSLVDCTSSVVYLPYMKYYTNQYMSALYMGEGLGGLIPALVGLGQGVGGDPTCVNASVTKINGTSNYTEIQIYPVYEPPRFSVQIFFFVLCGIMCLSAIGFTCLHCIPFFKKYQIRPDADTDTGKKTINNVKKPIYIVSEDGIEKVEDSAASEQASEAAAANKTPSKPRISIGKFILVLVLTGWINGLANSLIPATQSYSALPYGNTAYNLMVRLSVIANPLTCFIALFLPSNSALLLVVVSVFGSGLAGYQLYLAAMSPYPPLVGLVSGSGFVVSSYTRSYNNIIIQQAESEILKILLYLLQVN